MLTFTSVTSTGYTVVYPDGTTTVVSASYNNATGDGFIFFDSLTRYEFDATKVVCTGYNTAQFTQITPASVWKVPHFLGKFNTVNAVVTIGDKVYPLYPSKVEQVDLNNITITFSTAHAGVATVR